jgi:hypothetical protein
MRWLVIASILLSACMLDPQRQQRPIRLLLGANARDITNSENGATFRTESGEAAEKRHASHGAGTGDAQFTVAYRSILVGIELEEGRLATDGSNFAGAYSIVGYEHKLRSASFGVELASGWRGIRYKGDTDDVSAFVAEPRVRGQIQLSDQVTFGAVAGSTLGELGSWMAGAYLGFHSRAFGD